jgi:hypothetical protein
MRLLAFAFLVFAFAQPFLRKDNMTQVGKKAISIFVDNSFSMNALSQDVPLLELAKDRARAIIEAYNENDEFQILTQDFEGRHQRLVSKDDALSLIDEIEPSPSVKELSKVLERQKQILEASRDNKLIFWVSDFQKNIVDVESFSDTTIQLNLIPLQSVREQNISLDSVWLMAPVPMINQQNMLVVKVSNHADDKAEGVRLSLKYEGETKPMGTLNIPATGSAYDTINLSIRNTGWHEAELSITDFPVQFDDHYNICFEVSEDLRVLSINSNLPNRFLTAAFEGLSYFQLTNQSVNQIQYASLPSYDLVILNDLQNISTGLGSELKNYVSGGGNLLIFPSKNTELTSLNNFLAKLGANSFSKKIDERKEVFLINTDAFIFKDVFEKSLKRLKLPITETHFESSRIQSRGEQSLLTYRDGKSFLSQYNLNDGFIYICAAPLEDKLNDLVRNAEIFIPMLYKMAISKAKRTTLAYTIGKDNVIEIENKTSAGEMVYSIAGNEDFIPGQLAIGSKVLLDIHNQIKKDGFYDLKLEDELQGKFAFNYDRKESRLDYLGEAALLDKFGDVAQIYTNSDNTQFASVISQKGKSSTLWKWCLIAVLIFLALESLLLRFWKT